MSQRRLKTARVVVPAVTLTSIKSGENDVAGRSVTMCRPAEACHVSGARPRFFPSINTSAEPDPLMLTSIDPVLASALAVADDGDAFVAF